MPENLNPLPPMPDHPVGPPVVRPPLSRLAVIALITAFVLPPVGAVLGFIAKRRIQETGERGATISWVSGVVGTGLSIVLLIIALFGLAGSGASTASAPQNASTNSAGSRPGTHPGGSTTRQPEVQTPTLGAIATPTQTPTSEAGSGDFGIPSEGQVVPSDNQAARSRCSLFYWIVGQLPADSNSPEWGAGIAQLQMMASAAGSPMDSLTSAWIAATHAGDQAAADAAYNAVTEYCASLLR